MVEMTFREPSFFPRTIEEAQFLREDGECQRAQAKGEWLPEGWVWDEWPIEGIGNVEGALCEETRTFVWLQAQDGDLPLLYMAGGGGAAPVVFTMVFNRWWHREGLERAKARED